MPPPASGSDPSAAGRSGVARPDETLSLSEDSPSPRTRVIAVAGELDLYTAPLLKDAIVTAMNRGARAVVLDLTATDFIDASALYVFISAHKRLRLIDGRLWIINTDPGTAKVFEITGLDRVFSIAETREAALDALA